MATDIHAPIRQRALANFVLIALEEAGKTAGRLSVRAGAPDTMLLRYRDVRTLVRRDDGFGFASRDFAVVLACPASWPFVRDAALVPLIVEPHDFAAPNSDGRRLCLDLRGVLPERIPGLLYDQFRMRAFRLDHAVDAAAADWVRAHLDDCPADPRPLYPTEDVA